ncbi:DeoR/GlpR family DNA-binding transcription regulator [Cellulomonas sp. ICMP 17802]|uniref:DeoR/GlpR family DNA-binding transcription regulator n=1 Tax=Cellulomonas sp. ICMP 17802 TaxID=3239199 RepID=UPI00351BCE97
MLAAQRKELLLARLRADGRLVAKDLAAELDTSEDTIRRDLRELADAGLAQRVYGGAIPVAPAAASYARRQQIATGSKQRVAAACLQLVEPGSTLILDGGTTALEVARLLPRDPGLTVITHSPTIAVALVDHPAEVVILGGRLFKHSVVAAGAAAVEAAALVSADLFLLGVTGVRPDTGLTTGDVDEAAMKRALARRAAQTWVMASQEKIGAASPFPVLRLDEVAGIVSDADRQDPVLAELERTGVRVLRA